MQHKVIINMNTIKFYAILVAVLFATVHSFACTNVIVTKGASSDGSVMVTYAADSHQLYGALYFKPAAKWKEDAVLKVYNWDSGEYMGEIPQIAATYQTVGNMNQHQLIITETTFGGREQTWGGGGVMDYGSLIFITLQRARTAREAIEVMDELTQKYGYPSEGESFSIADKYEAWIMEMVGKGDGSGSVWVARRIPDGYICAHANQSRISTFPLDDPDNCLYSSDVISFAREKGWFSGKDEEFSFCDAYNPVDFGGARFCDSRAGAAFNRLCGGAFVWEDARLDEMGYRRSPYTWPGTVVTAVELQLIPDDGTAAETMADCMRRRREKQPLSLPSAGSTFKRPVGHFAGALIEGCHLKGCAVGGAHVSELHAGFIVNRGGATAGDIHALIRHVQDVVYGKTGVMLEPEVKRLEDIVCIF